LEKQRGNMGMTWKVKVARVAFAMAIVSGLAMASGADWVQDFFRWLLAF
jgi:hypothetical protein